MKSKQTMKRIIGLLLAAVQLVLSGVLLYQFFAMNFLPYKYFLLLLLVFLIAALLVFGLQFVKGLHWLAKGISIVLIIALIIGLISVGKADRTLSAISTNVDIEKNQVLVVVKNDSSAQTISDLKGAVFGIQYADDVELMGRAADELRTMMESDLQLSVFDNYGKLYPALFDGTVDAMIMNSSYLELLNEITAEDGYLFSDEVRIVETLDIAIEKAEQETEEEKEPFDIAQDPFLLYISGIDTYGDITTRSRSDVNILMAVNPKNKQILLVTTPRDAYVPLAGVSGSSRDKLTHAGIYGINCSIDTMESIYGQDILGYARVNFNSLIGIVDALGGVEVYSAYDFSTGKYQFVKGYNHMDGEKALSFSRERYSFADGDHQRGRDQMEVIKGIINKCTSPAILSGFTGILEEVSSQVQTSLSTEDLYALVKMELDNPGNWEMFSYETTSKGAREYCYSYSGKSLYVGYLVEDSLNQAKKAIERLMNNERITQADVAQ